MAIGYQQQARRPARLKKKSLRRQQGFSVVLINRVSSIARPEDEQTGLSFIARRSHIMETAGKKAARTRKRRKAARKAATTRKRRAAARKAAATRKAKSPIT
jgi:hypothetical protein